MPIKDTLAIRFQMISAGAAEGGGAFGALCSLGEGLELGRWDLEGLEKLAVTTAGEGVVELDGGLGGSDGGIVMV